MHKQKGIALFLVLFTSLIFFIIIIGLLYILGANLRQLQAYDKKTEGFYLCETAASLAILDIRNHRVGSGPGQWLERSFNLVLDGISHPISYTVGKQNGEWTIVSTSGDSHLRVGGIRAFPIFIRGFAGR